MLFNKKPKTEQPVTPEELSKFNDKSIADSDIKHLHVRNDSIDVINYKKKKKILTIVISSMVFVLLVLWIISMLLTQWGDLVISVDSFAGRKGIIISEDPEFGTYSHKLSAKQVKDVTNITYTWLPTDLDTYANCSHNGKNYVAYTFYCKNNGQESLYYDSYLEVTGVAKSADEAVRVLVYKNGEQAMYGKATYNDRSIAETDCTMFETDSRVMSTATENFEVDQVDKYTIVIWAEGNDPECIDDIRGGHVRMRMLLEVREDEDDEKLFGANVFN